VFNVGISLEQQNQGKGIQMTSRNMKSRVKPSTQKRVATPFTKQRHPPEAKQHKGIEKPQQQAPAVPPARTFIRPHQVYSSLTNTFSARVGS